MSMWWSFVLALAAGSAIATDELTPMTQIEAVAGRNLLTEVMTNSDSVHGCFLLPPKGEVIQFLPEDLSDDKYQLENPIPLRGCRVTIKDIDHNDAGIWELYYTSEDATLDKKASQYYNVSVGSQDLTTASPDDVEGSTIASDGLTPMTQIEAVAGRNLLTEVMTNSDSVHGCFLLTPKGEVIQFLPEDSSDDKYQLESPIPLRGCRVTIKDIDHNDTGIWELYYTSEDAPLDKKASQYYNVSVGSQDLTTASPNDVEGSTIPSDELTPMTQIEAVAGRNLLTEVMTNSDSVHGCFLLTPKGEVIQFLPEDSSDDKYQLENPIPLRGCRVTIKDIDHNDAGIWELYYTSEDATLDKKASQYYNVSVASQGSTIASDGLTPMTQIEAVAGRNLLTEVMTNSDSVHGCFLLTPKGEVIQFLPEDSSDDKYQLESPIPLRGCRVTIKDIDHNDAGIWELYYTSEDAPLDKKASQYYNVSVGSQDLTTASPNDVEGSTIASDGLTPMTQIEAVAGRNLLTEVMTNSDSVHGCFLLPPKGEVIQFLPEDLSDDKYQLETPIPLRGCRVTIKDIDHNDAGIWELYYTSEDAPLDKKASQYYNVSVSSQGSSPDDDDVKAVKAEPSAIAVAEGSNVHVRLARATPHHDSCALLGPTSSSAQRDSQPADVCGFVVANVSLADAGTWAIVYGTDTRYEATIRVTVTARSISFEDELEWTKNLPLNVMVGPEDAVYCRIVSPKGFVVSEGFGRCNIVLDRVGSEHAGVWKAAVGTQGSVLVDNYEFVVRVKTAQRAQVTTAVESKKPSVTLSCRVESPVEITACKFRDPSGRVLLASQGVGEGRYSFRGAPVDIHSEVSKRQCQLRITNPVADNLGRWRCAVQTKQDTFYGFLTVVWPWADRDPAAADTVLSEPVLMPEVDSVTVLEDDQVALRCSVQSAIHYCYFSAPNGTVFNVSPGSSEWFEYEGAGLDAGECGIRFPGLQEGDSGLWSCHVGFHDQLQPEQRASMALRVQAEMFAEMQDYGRGHLMVRGQVHSQRPLEYCRFVRRDGPEGQLGFTSENVPRGYENRSILSKGLCEITVRNADIWERFPWTVVAKIAGQDFEVARSTQSAFDAPVPEQTERPERPVYVRPRSNFAAMWTFILVLSMSLLLVGLMLGPRRHREWTYSRAAVVRNSFRRNLPKNQQPQVFA